MLVRRAGVSHTANLQHPCLRLQLCRTALATPPPYRNPAAAAASARPTPARGGGAIEAPLSSISISSILSSSPPPLSPMDPPLLLAAVATVSLYALYKAVRLALADADLYLLGKGEPAANAFQGKVVWITGASQGLGAVLARHFASKGAKLILSSRSVDKLQVGGWVCLCGGWRAGYCSVRVCACALLWCVCALLCGGVESHVIHTHMWEGGGPVDLLPACLAPRLACSMLLIMFCCMCPLSLLLPDLAPLPSPPCRGNCPAPPIKPRIPNPSPLAPNPDPSTPNPCHALPINPRIPNPRPLAPNPDPSTHKPCRCRPSRPPAAARRTTCCCCPLTCWGSTRSWMRLQRQRTQPLGAAASTTWFTMQVCSHAQVQVCVCGGEGGQGKHLEGWRSSW